MTAQLYIRLLLMFGLGWLSSYVVSIEFESTGAK